MIYKGSRYAYSDVFYDNDEDKVFLGTPKIVFTEEMGDIEIPFTSDMRLDLLAYKYYNDPQLDWVILQANPQFTTPEDITVGSLIKIPAFWRVMDNV